MTHLNLRRQKSRLLWLIAGILLICGAVGILIFPSETATGAGRGLAYCINILVPSLFPFMALSTLIVISGFAERIGRWFHRTVSVLFYLPGCAGAAILMSLIGGYPVGAKGIAGLWKQGALTDEQAARMLCFCVNSGPAFVLTAVGCGMLGSIKSGLLLLTALIIPPILFGIITGIFARKRQASCKTKTPERKEPLISPKQQGIPAIVSATEDASRAMLAMCAFVILFNALNFLLHASGIAEVLTKGLSACGFSAATASALPSVLLEVVGGCTECAVTGVGLPVIAFALGWGGFCIHFQIFSIVGRLPFPKWRFFFFRFLHGVCSAFLVMVLQRLLPIEIPSFSNTTDAVVAGTASSLPGTVALLLLSAFFLITMKKSRICRKRVL